MRRVLSLLLLMSCAAAPPLVFPSFDFFDAGSVAEWKPAHSIQKVNATRAGMRIDISGADPYVIGPPEDYPAALPLRITIRLKSDQGGIGRLYYFTDHATEAQSARFNVRAGAWDEAKIFLPALGPGYHLRINPPGDRGACVIRWIHVMGVPPLREPQWPIPATSKAEPGALSLHSGALSLTHAGSGQQAFVVKVGKKPTAIGWNRSVIGYRDGTWVLLDDSANCRWSREGDNLLEACSARDRQGATWSIGRRYAPGPQTGSIDIETTVTVDHDRDVVFLPMLGLCPGVGSFGTAKTQALFPGLEYLDNEPSSSEADVIGPASHRQVPDSLKITFPLMTLVADGRYVGLIWEKRPEFAAVFDSPDRLFQSGGHVMGVIFPGSDGTNRVEGSLLPRESDLLHANERLLLRATIIGGIGTDATAAVRQYVSLRGLPPVPTKMQLQQYVRLASAGWLDSKIREGDDYRHAIPGNFGLHPAADAAMFEQWLATQSDAPLLRDRLEEAARAAIARVEPPDYNSAAVSHVRYPVEALLFGHVEETCERAASSGRALLQRFESDGSVHYHPAPGQPDLGKTNPVPHANGLTSAVLVQVLKDAAVSGDADLAARGIALLRNLDKFSGTAPRGAQTWEVPLHTPDILASAHLVRAYTLGYELTGEPHFLDQAKYWAWTGVPFVYLDAPTQPVGPYASVPVFGATQWRAPVWMGMPVQWCALVYADALYRLLPYDSSGPWKQLADGITISGMQQTWPAGSDPVRQGLLPDSYNLRPQSRNDPAINPGTLQAEAARLYSRIPLYEFHAFAKAGFWLHVPGRIGDVRDEDGGASFIVESWSPRPYYVLAVGFKKEPKVLVNGAAVNLRELQQYIEGKGRVILQLSGPTTLEFRGGRR